MSSSLNAPNVELSQYTAVLRRRWRWVVLGVVVGVTLSALAIFLLPKTYESTASVLVNSLEGESGSVEGGRTTSTLNLDTEAQIVTSSVVSGQVAENLDVAASPTSLADQTSVSVPPNTAVLDITFRSASAAGAREGASAFADAYLANRQAIADETLDQSAAQFQDRISSLNEELRDVGEQIQDLPEGSAQRSYAESRRQLLVNQIDTLNQQAPSAEPGSTNPGRVITDAVEPTAPAEPNIPIVGLSGVLMGLLGGVVLAFAVDRRDKSIRDRQDLDRIGLDVLAPDFAVPPAGVIASPLDARYDAQSMRMLRNSLLAQLPGHRGSILIAAASSGALGSTVALNLAATLARGGLKVRLAFADSDLTNRHDVESTRSGLAEVLEGRVNFEHVLKPMDGVPGLEVVYPGRDGSLYSELLQSEAARELMAELRRGADVLVVDVSPMSVNADAQSLAAQFDGVVLVAEQRHTTVDHLMDAIDQLRHVSARVMGGVVARHDSTTGTHMHSRTSERHSQTVR